MSPTISSPITLVVDAANPGQFLACCGLLELADRLAPGAEGWFRGNEFFLRSARGLRNLLDELLRTLPEEVLRLENDLPVAPIIAPLRFRCEARQWLYLDPWMAIRLDRQRVVTAANAPWNFWSGQQTPLRIWTPLRTELARQLPGILDADLPQLFAFRVLLSGRFGFDPGAAWNALDVGFSPNAQKIEVASSAAVELLAAVGLQRFRPSLSARRDSFEYATWGIPLSPAIAAAAAVNLVPAPPSVRYRARVVDRGNYAALGYASLVDGDRNE